MKLYDSIGYDYKKSLNQSKTFTKSHVRYDITLKRYDNQKTLYFEYQCNPKYSKIKKDDLLYSALMDASCYESCDDDIEFFASSLEIEKVGEAIRCFNSCKKIYNELIDFFGSYDAYKMMLEKFENY